MRMSKKEYVNYALAKKLKKKGFPWRKNIALAMYTEDGTLLSLCPKDEEYYDFDDFDHRDYMAPTLEQVLGWLRSKGIHVYCFTVKDGDTDADRNLVGSWSFWTFNVMNTSGDMIYDDDTTEYKTYEDACKGGIKYCLDNLL